MDRPLLLTLLVFAIVVGALFLLSQPGSPKKTVHTLPEVNKPSEPTQQSSLASEENTPPTSVPPFLEEACEAYRRDLDLFYRDKEPLQNCVVDCGVTPRGTCPDVYVILLSVRERLSEENVYAPREDLVIYRALTSVYTNLLDGNIPDLTDKYLTTLNYTVDYNNFTVLASRAISEENAILLRQAVLSSISRKE